MNTTINLILPVEVKRDEMGNWHHPNLPTFYGTDESTEASPAWGSWLDVQGLEVSRSSLEDEDESHPVYQSYFEAENPSGDFSAWTPESPEGDGWFMLAITDTEDGPCAWFVRRTANTLETK